MHLIWKPEFSVGVAAIDAQHLQLLRIANDLNRPDQLVDFVVVTDKLKRYIDQHFRFEEDLMRQHAYPMARQHVIQHDVLRVSYAAFNAGAKDEQAVARTRTLIFRWFVSHVIEDEMDMGLGRHLLGLGIVPAETALT